MTESEAWKCVFEKPYVVSCDDYEEAKQIIKTALEDVQQYREIGTVEECREAVEKQKIIKKPVKDEYCGFVSYECPICHHDVTNVQRYCDKCGQKLGG